MLFNFRQILFPAKGAGLKICPVFVRKQLWERSECTLIVGPAVWGRGPYKVKSVKHIFSVLPPSGRGEVRSLGGREQGGRVTLPGNSHSREGLSWGMPRWCSSLGLSASQL